MKSFKELYVYPLVLIILLFIAIFAHAVRNEQDILKREAQLMNDPRYREVHETIKMHIRHEREKKLTTKQLLKSSLTGFARGTMMGAILNGLEGAAAGGTLFALVNPIIAGFEHKLS